MMKGGNAKRGSGLIVEITDGDFFGYRGNRSTTRRRFLSIRLAMAMAYELRKTKIPHSPSLLDSCAPRPCLIVSE